MSITNTEILVESVNYRELNIHNIYIYIYIYIFRVVIIDILYTKHHSNILIFLIAFLQ